MNYTCGIGEEQGNRLLSLVNAILEKNLDVTPVLAEINNKLPKYSGTLVPASDPPSAICAESRGHLKLILGTNAIIDPSTEDVLRVGENDRVAMRYVRGGIAIAAHLTSEDQKLVVEIRNNDFLLNRNNTFDVRTPDDSTLIVRNDKGLEVLNVRFCNPTTVRIKGIFFLGNGRRLELNDQGFKEVGTPSGLDVVQGVCLGPNVPGLRLFSNRPDPGRRQ